MMMDRQQGSPCRRVILSQLDNTSPRPRDITPPNVDLLPSMASLPSFVQLMASLGLSDRPSLSSTPPTSRYAPYSPSASCHRRNDSHSSTSSLSDPEPSLIRHRPRKYRHKASRSDSSSDIPSNTPISTYVRRKTPGSSPVSATFDSGYESAPSQPHPPFSVPTLPVLLTNAPNSDPESPTSDSDGQFPKGQDYYRFIRQRTGTRISAARAARREQISRRYLLPN